MKIRPLADRVVIKKLEAEEGNEYTILRQSDILAVVE